MRDLTPEQQARWEKRQAEKAEFDHTMAIKVLTKSKIYAVPEEEAEFTLERLLIDLNAYCETEFWKEWIWESGYKVKKPAIPMDCGTPQLEEEMSRRDTRKRVRALLDSYEEADKNKN